MQQGQVALLKYVGEQSTPSQSSVKLSDRRT